MGEVLSTTPLSVLTATLVATGETRFGIDLGDDLFRSGAKVAKNMV